MPRNTNTTFTMPRRTNTFYAILNKQGELDSYVSNPQDVELRGQEPAVRIHRLTYDTLHNAGYFVNVERRIASMDAVALYKYCQKLPQGVFFNGFRLTKTKKQMRQENETIEEVEEERAQAEEYFKGRGRTANNTLSDHLEHLIPSSRRNL